MEIVLKNKTILTWQVEKNVLIKQRLKNVFIALSSQWVECQVKDGTKNI